MLASRKLWLLKTLGFSPMLVLDDNGFLEASSNALSRPAQAALPTLLRWRLRPLYPLVLQELPVQISRNDLLRLLPELIWSHLQLLHDRLVFGKGFKGGAAARAALAVERLDTFRLAQAIARRRSLLSLPDVSPDVRSDSVPLDNLPKGPSASLAARIAQSGEVAQLLELVNGHLIRQAGLLALDGATWRPGATYLTDPIALLAFVSVAQSQGLSISDPPEEVTLALTERCLGRSLIELLTLPDLPLPALPEPPVGVLAELVQEAQEQIEVSAIQECGFSIRIDPVPKDGQFVLCLRRDVDRAIGRGELIEHLSWEEKAELNSTWYFKPDTFDPELAHQVLAAGDEIGWHACHPRSGDKGLIGQLRQLQPKVGVNHHGGHDTSYWRGRRTVEELRQQNVAYGERIGQWSAHPLADFATGLMLTPQSFKIESRPGWCAEHERLIRRHRGLMSLETHPDLWTSQLAQQLDEWRKTGAAVRRIGDHVAVCSEIMNADATRSGDLVGLPALKGASARIATRETTKYLGLSDGVEVKLPVRKSFSAS